MTDEQIRRRVRAAIRDYGLIAPGDHVVAGLSGGKDSLALVELLGDWRRCHNRNFRLTAVHICMPQAGYRSDTAYLSDFCAAAGVDFRAVEARFEPDRNPRRSPCFLCSWTRRKSLFQFARENGVNKIAFGHHEDDILRTALMNLTFSGSFSTMPVRLAMRKFPVSLIRPLCRVGEAALSEMAARHGYRPVDKRCPHDQAGKRRDIAALFREAERQNLDFRHSLWHALEAAGKLVEE